MNKLIIIKGKQVLKVLTTQAEIIVRYDFDERGKIDSGADYYICAVDPMKPEQSKELLDTGFVFHDRRIVMERVLKNERHIAKQGDIVIKKDSIDHMVYEVAYLVFTKDRRFHLLPMHDQKRAIPVIKAYIDECVKQNMMAYKAFHDDELLGFAIVLGKGERENISHNAIRGGIVENFLGAVKPGIKGKITANILYSSMLNGESDSFHKYVGKVSSENVASLNLHYGLGAKAVSVYDLYIKRIKRT